MPFDQAIANPADTAGHLTRTIARGRVSGALTEVFDSVDAYIELRPMLEANAADLSKSLDESGAWRKRKGGERWYGVADVNSVMNAIRNGWPEGVVKLQAMRAQLTGSFDVQSIRRVLCRDDHGDEFDVHRSYSGGFDTAWTRRKRGPRRTNRAISIVFEGGGLFEVDSTAFFWRGAAALCLIDMLTTAGYSVEVVTASLATGVVSDEHSKRGAYQSVCVLKHSDMPVDLSDLAAGLCLAGFHRVATFRKRCELPHRMHSFGYTAKPVPADFDREGAIVVPNDKISTQATAQAWLTQAIEQLERGIE